jgi:hypothetical protein
VYQLKRTLLVKMGFGKSETSLKNRAAEVRQILKKGFAWPEAARDDLARTLLIK